MYENEAESKAEEFNILKVILKTSLVFTLFFLLLVLLIFNLMALFFPGFVSDISASFGMNNISAEFSIGNYNKTKDYEDLAAAVERCIIAKKHDKVAKYTEILVNYKNSKNEFVFPAFCKIKDKQLNDYYEANSINKTSNYFVYIYGNYVYSLYKTEQKKEAYKIAADYTNETNYTTNNMLTMFVNAYVEDKEKPDVKIIELLKKLYDKLEIEDVEQKFFAKNICLDLIIIYHNLNDAVNIQIWESAFEEINS